ncbi:MAG: hypothetical protein C0469_14670 [Cyanobacteria bacterium DS2.3.42]|nr:hypothetical protein [Cyanobacteria bacterium DS2.3.42]
MLAAETIACITNTAQKNGKWMVPASAKVSAADIAQISVQIITAFGRLNFVELAFTGWSLN